MVGTAGFSVRRISSPTIQIVSGTPYVRYNEPNTTSDPISVKKWNGTDWEFIGKESTLNGDGGGSVMKIVNNIPYLLTSNWLYKFNGTDWEKMGNSISTPQALDFDGNTPYTAYKAGETLVVYKYNGTSFERVGGSVSTSGNPNYISLAINNGTPYIVPERKHITHLNTDSYH